ncbi:hypothetical protein LVJ83_01675 [Uruburuella testudinis]|uniref:Uncharacterized protein n=1 Tax=Uruburuella testudinis TaxID=1282863 RepID=A0ABY4DTN0_9NEIS|nr:hypothetical protein [Uruburuella testudinis]UOO82211.1 hypothetical protein LVJ83_01675 [Uruburuella testudinis]
MFETLKQQWHRFETEHLTPQQPDPISYHAAITPDYLTGEANGKEFGRIAWQDIEIVAINIEGDFEPFPYWYIGRPNQGVRLPQDTENMADMLAALAQYLPHFASDTTRREIDTAMQASEGRYYIWQR